MVDGGNLAPFGIPTTIREWCNPAQTAFEQRAQLFNRKKTLTSGSKELVVSKRLGIVSYRKEICFARCAVSAVSSKLGSWYAGASSDGIRAFPP